MPDGDVRMIQLAALREALTSVVSTVEAIGADGVSDLRLYAAVRDKGRRPVDILLDGGELNVMPARPDPIFTAASSGDACSGDADIDREAILLAGLCQAASAWNWSLGQLAAAIPCGEDALGDWLERAAASRTVGMPLAAEQGIRRLVVIDHQRHLAGICDRDAAGWVDAARPELRGLSIGGALSALGEHGFGLVQVALGYAASAERAAQATVH